MIFFSVYDTAIEAYTRPFVMRTRGEALRSFINECENPESPMKAHPEDYALFELGSFDENSGEIVGVTPCCIARAHELAALSKEK